MIPHKVICFGEILWDNFPNKIVPGGAPLNVAFHAKNLGLNTILYSAIGNDQPGRKLLQFINEIGLNNEFIEIQEEYPTGSVTVNIENPKEVSYTIDGPSAWDHIKESILLANTLEATDILVFGTLSCREIESRTALNSILQSPAYKVMDLNLRPPHYDKKLVEHLLLHTDLLKVNREEYEQLKNWFSINGDAKKGFDDLVSLFGLDALVITSGSKGSRYLSHNADVVSKVFEIDCVDTVGAGDSFLAALIYGKLSKFDQQYMVDFASGLGALVAGKMGATPKLSEEEIVSFINQISPCIN